MVRLKCECEAGAGRKALQPAECEQKTHPTFSLVSALQDNTVLQHGRHAAVHLLSRSVALDFSILQFSFQAIQMLREDGLNLP